MRPLSLLRAPSLADFDETRWHPDPFGSGVEFEIARTDSRSHEEWSDRRHRENPLLVRIGYLASTLEEELDFKALRKRAFEELVKEGTAPGDLDVTESLERALDLLKGWRGLKEIEGGAEVPYSLDVARELLTCATTVVRSGPFRGMDLGIALQLWIISQAQAHADERQQLLEALEKNSEPSSESAAP